MPIATLVGSNRFRAGLVVLLPATLLVAIRIHEVFASFAAGVRIGIPLFLVWMSHEFVRPTSMIEANHRTVVKSEPFGLGDYSPMDVDDTERVTILAYPPPRPRHSLARFHVDAWTPASVWATAVPAPSTDGCSSQLERLGVDGPAPSQDLTPLSALPTVRLAATPLVLAGALFLLWYRYGRAAIRTDVVVVPSIVTLLYAAYGTVWRRSGSPV